MNILQAGSWVANEYIQFFSQAVLLLAFFKIALRYAVKKLKQISSKTSTKFDDIIIFIIESLPNWKLFLVALLIPVVNLQPFPTLNKFFQTLLIVTVASIFSVALVQVTEKVSENYLKKNPSTKTIVGALKKLAAFIVWLIAAIIILDQYGVNINTLIAGLGIGGVAAALAVQSILADLFSAVTLYIDRPFNVGDYISFGNVKGTITKIGLKSTTLKTTIGTVIIVSNKDLTGGQIENFGRMKDRTISFDLGVSYDTDVEKLDLIHEIVAKSVETNEAHLIHCRLTELQDFTLNFNIRYKLDTKDYQEYLRLNEQILMSILTKFKQESIEIPFPTQNILHKSI